MKASALFTHISRAILALLILLLPFFFLPVTADFFGLPKITLFIILTLASFFCLLLSGIDEKKISLISGPYLTPLLALFLAGLVSLIGNFSTIDKYEAIWALIPLLILPLFYLLVKTLFRDRKTVLKTLLLITGAVIGLVQIVFFALPAKFFPLKANFFGFPLAIPNSGFSPSGNTLTTLVFLVSLFPLALGQLELLKKSLAKTGLLATGSLLIGAGALAAGLQAFKTNPISLLPQQTSWIIALETLKNMKNALIGVGSGQFLSAFTRFRPMNYNLSPLWSLRFGLSSSEILQTLTTLGLLGLLGLFWLGKVFVSNNRGQKKSSFWASLVILISFFLLPASFLIWFWLVAYLALDKHNESEKTLQINSGQVGNIMLIGGGVILGLAYYFLGRNFLAEVTLRRSLVMAAQNNGAQTYNLQIKAIGLNPYKADFHQAYSQTNFAIANNLAAKKPEELTEEDKQMITQLIQQTIREARIATELSPQSVFAWENLAYVYRQLINMAKDAEQWAMDTYQVALRLDPNNPQLYLDLGGLYYSLGRYDEALNLFNNAAMLKPDYANAFYNLASAFNQKKDYVSAVKALERAAQLVKQDSPDYQKVQTELEELKKNLPSPTPTPKTKITPAPTEELTLPEPIASPEPETTPIEMPAEEQPTETPTPEETP